MKTSLRVKVTLIVSLTLAASILLCWVLNATLLDEFYKHTKTSLLDGVYKDVSGLFDADFCDYELSENTVRTLTRSESADNVELYILKPEGGAYLFIYPLMSTAKDVRSLEFERVKYALTRYIYGGGADSGEMVSLVSTKADKYDIYRMFDDTMEQNYIDLVGYLENDYLIFIRASLESIGESVSIANRFLMLTGIATILLSSVIVMFISRTITKPINQLSVIATKVSNLDFDAKYEGRRKDEVGDLGKSINAMSDKLELTISELKTANAGLNRDIQSKIEAEKVRSEFLSGVTHELKTPIALIQGYAEGLLENINDDPESRRFYCDVIIDEAQKMNKMVQKLLSLDRIESGSNNLEYSRFDITQVIKAALDSSSILAKQKNVRIYFDENEPAFIWADEYMAELVVSNYISNAFNHVCENGIIEIKLIRLEKTVRIAVFNTGSDIPEEDIGKIWDKFYKVDKARTREYGGNGIGLSIVKAVMTAHNKQYGVVNRETGVEFYAEFDSEN